MADISGAIGLVGLAVSVIQAIADGNNTSDAAISQFEQQLQEFFTQLQAQAAGNAVQQQQVQIDNQWGAVKAAWEILAADPQSYRQNPASGAASYQAALAAVLAMSQLDGYWNLGYSDWPFWNDSGDHTWPRIVNGDQFMEIDGGYGQVMPPLSPSNEALNYSLILPRYLQSVVNMTGIAYILGGPDLEVWLSTATQTVIPLLQTVLDTIISNIQPLRPAWTDWNGQSLGFWAVVQDGSGSPDVVPGLSPLGGSIEVLNSLEASRAGVNIEYGAVDVFSGYSSMGNYPLMFSDMFPWGSTDAGPARKFQMRVMARVNHVAIQSGMKIWLAINHLRAMTGAPPLPPYFHSTWSLRFLASMVFDGTKPMSLLEFKRFLRDTPPTDTDPIGTSFKALLSPVETGAL
jgi:hypothetical protein